MQNTFHHSAPPSVRNYGITNYDGSDFSPPRMISSWKDVISTAEIQNFGQSVMAQTTLRSWYIYNENSFTDKTVSLFSKQIPAYVIRIIMYKLFFYKGYYSETESSKLGVTVYDLSSGKMHECSWPMFDKNLAYFQSET